MKVREGSKDVKKVYKGWKSKMRDNTPPKKYSNKFESNGGPHSAPSSPVFSKREQNESSYGRRNHVSTQQELNTRWHDKNNFNNNNYSSKNAQTPALSPGSSSDSTSDMNLLQELQQHEFFKSPAVNRNVS